jgi:NAD(P)H-dependent flavin oxidoreductase YrpB (nitropropane dioxygenase family)
MSLPAVLQGRLSVPVIGAPMFIVSVPDLVIAQCKAGIVGIVGAGLDPDNLQVADPSKMNFADGGAHRRAWRDIWGAGQGIGAVKAVVGAGDLVARLKREYEAALDELSVNKSRRTTGSGALPVFAGSALPPLA